MSVSLRIWIASAALLLLVAATLVMIGFHVMNPDAKVSMPALATVAFVWIFAIPNVLRLRTMVADHRRGRKPAP